MDLLFTPEQEQFRERLKNWLNEVIPEVTKNDHSPDRFENMIINKKIWEKNVYEAGYAGLTWPKEYGGQGKENVYQIIFNEECGRVNAPATLNVIGNNILGPTLLEYGTEEQKRRFLPQIVSGNEIWCQGFSEPNAGSDLASLSTKAELKGNKWIINGQKIWASWAQFSQYCILLARTDNQAKKHKGITFFLVPMNLKGVTVKPLVQMNNEKEFSEIFFDDVELDQHLVLGEVNDGWNVAMRALSFERGTNPLGKQAKFHKELVDLVKLAKTIKDGNGNSITDNPYFQQKIAKAFSELEVMKYMGYEVVNKLMNNQKITFESSVQKLYWSEYHKRFGDLAMEIQRDLSIFWEEDGLLDGKFQNIFLHSRAETIYAGTSEIQKNIIAERILEMPR